MVAYSFNAAFIGPIVARAKRQTIRPPRKRHARPGERVQLFHGMRTRNCHKLIPDPVCVGLDEVRLDLRALSDVSPTQPRWRDLVALIVNGIPLFVDDADAYAEADGFGRKVVGPSRSLTPFEHLVCWWMTIHGPVLFDGVAIRWEDRDVG